MPPVLSQPCQFPPTGTSAFWQQLPSAEQSFLGPRFLTAWEVNLTAVLKDQAVGSTGFVAHSWHLGTLMSIPTEFARLYWVCPSRVHSVPTQLSTLSPQAYIVFHRFFSFSRELRKWVIWSTDTIGYPKMLGMEGDAGCVWMLLVSKG